MNIMLGVYWFRINFSIKYIGMHAIIYRGMFANFL